MRKLLPPSIKISSKPIWLWKQSINISICYCFLIGSEVPWHNIVKNTPKNPLMHISYYANFLWDYYFWIVWHKVVCVKRFSGLPGFLDQPDPESKVRASYLSVGRGLPAYTSTMTLRPMVAEIPNDALLLFTRDCLHAPKWAWWDAYSSVSNRRYAWISVTQGRFAKNK